jgi:transcriptional regulator with XRE-family HTH domain
MTEIAERVRELRKGQGMSQAELGNKLGKGRLAITKLEQGQRSITVEEAQALAQALGVSLMYLLEGEKTQESQEEGVELRFEVIVRLLPSRGEKPAFDPFLDKIRNDPELQRAYREQQAREAEREREASKRTFRARTARKVPGASKRRTKE